VNGTVRLSVGHCDLIIHGEVTSRVPFVGRGSRAERRLAYRHDLTNAFMLTVQDMFP
jgi:hypothetical protein